MELGADRRWARVAGRTARSRHWASVRAERAAGGRERAWRAGRARVRRASVLGRAGRACWGAQGERAEACKASVLGRAGRQEHGRWRARVRASERQLGPGASGRQGVGRAAGRRWACAARAAWAPGLALGSALGALGPFSIRFDSFFFLSHQMNTVHCKIKIFFSKKKIMFIKFK